MNVNRSQTLRNFFGTSIEQTLGKVWCPLNRVSLICIVHTCKVQRFIAVNYDFIGMLVLMSSLYLLGNAKPPYTKLHIGKIEYKCTLGTEKSFLA